MLKILSSLRSLRFFYGCWSPCGVNTAVWRTRRRRTRRQWKMMPGVKSVSWCSKSVAHVHHTDVTLTVLCTCIYIYMYILCVIYIYYMLIIDIWIIICEILRGKIRIAPHIVRQIRVLLHFVTCNSSREHLRCAKCCGAKKHHSR